MKTKKILNLDYRYPKNKDIIQTALKQIKPLSKYSDEIPIDILEKCLFKLCSKYKIWLALGFANPEDESMLWKFTVQYFNPINNIDKIYGICLYEVIAKSIILIYSTTRKKK